MDSFHESLKNLPNHASLPTKRIHFHQFMVDIHKRNHNLQSQLHSDGQLGQADVLITIAREIAEECKVLCFDEFQVCVSLSLYLWVPHSELNLLYLLHSSGN